FNLSRTPKTTVSPSIENERAKSGGGLEYVKTFNVAGREWLVLCVPAPDYIAKNNSLQPYGVLSVGLLLTGLLTGFLLVNLKRSQQLSIANEQLLRQIAERKHAEEVLYESEERFRTIFIDGPVGMVLASPDY